MLNVTILLRLWIKHKFIEIMSNFAQKRRIAIIHHSGKKQFYDLIEIDWERKKLKDLNSNLTSEKAFRVYAKQLTPNQNLYF